jgi:hypothetical protein
MELETILLSEASQTQEDRCVTEKKTESRRVTFKEEGREAHHETHHFVQLICTDKMMKEETGVNELVFQRASSTPSSSGL